MQFCLNVSPGDTGFMCSTPQGAMRPVGAVRPHCALWSVMCVLCLPTVSWVIFAIFGVHSISVKLKFEFPSLFVAEVSAGWALFMALFE